MPQSASKIAPEGVVYLVRELSLPTPDGPRIFPLGALVNVDWKDEVKVRGRIQGFAVEVDTADVTSDLKAVGQPEAKGVNAED